MAAIVGWPIRTSRLLAVAPPAVTLRSLLSEQTNHYATLGLDRRCTTAQIRAAYRLLSKQFHPDMNPDSPAAVQRSRELNAAHEILASPARRRAYDRELDFRAEPVLARAARLERNIAHDVRLRIEDFIRGVALEVGVHDPANPNGPEIYPLQVPPESAPGTRFRVPRSTPFEGGFVVMRLRVFPNPRFKVRGSDLQCDLRIHARRATQGGSEMLTGATGTPLRIQVPAGIGRGAILRIPGEGMPKPRGGRGDLLVRVTYRPEVRVTRR